MSKRHLRHANQCPAGAASLTDTALLEMLLGAGKLTADQTEAFVGYLTVLTSGQRNCLTSTVRDHAMAVAKAQGLLAKTQLKKQPPKPLTLDGNQYSIDDRTPGAKFAKELLAKPLPLRPPTRKAG